MIIFQRKEKDIFNGEGVLVNPVNCVGVMGKGLALEFKNKYPENFNKYKEACDKNLVDFTKPLVYTEEYDGKIIVNLPTKYHWKDKSTAVNILDSLIQLKNLIQKNKYKEIHIPAIGCGLGGLDYSLVSEMITSMSHNLSSNTIIYLYPPKE